MFKNSRPRLLLALTALIIGGLALVGCEQVDLTGSDRAARFSQQGPESRHQLAEVREATAAYQNLVAAEKDGYVQFSLHVPGMGTHYLKKSAINPNGSSALDATLDRTDPEILVYVDDAAESPQRRLVAVEYAVPKESSSPPQNAANLFRGADASDWHVHPSGHDLGLAHDWTVHGECHYEGGLGVFLAEKPDGSFVLLTPLPPTDQAVGTWSGTVGPEACPSSLGGNPLPPLLIVHPKWWTLHAWVWLDNPEGVFNPTNPRVSP